jgi:hypothetical protein
MSRWFRHYAGMARDDKLVRIAIRTKQTIERVVWVWSAILESAAERDDSGTYEIDTAEIAYFLRADEPDVQSIVRALADANHLDSAVVVKWGSRQFQSDRSAERQARYRERKKTEIPETGPDQLSRDGQVTSPSRHRDAPETETYTDTELEKKKVRRATRIPDGFKPDLEWAVNLGLTPSQASSEASKFRDYWVGKGANATKTDWPATWRNWVRTAAERLPRAGPNVKPRTASDVLMNLSNEMKAAENVQQPSRSDFVPPRQLPRLSQRPGDGSEGLFDGDTGPDGYRSFQDR